MAEPDVSQDASLRDKPLTKYPYGGIVLTALAGSWLILTSLVFTLGWHPAHGRMHGHGRFLWHHDVVFHYAGQVYWNWFGAIFGALMLLAAGLMVWRPKTAIAWASGVIVFSLIVLVSGAGGIVAGILGLLGGILAVLWQPIPKGP
ncbi:MAG: hypothetical protein ACLFUJ_15420 [Phycisphaerae bacterium]